MTLDRPRLTSPITISLNELLARDPRGRRLPDREWLIAID
jgi:hypothetical protein